MSGISSDHFSKSEQGQEETEERNRSDSISAKSEDVSSFGHHQISTSMQQHIQSDVAEGGGESYATSSGESVKSSGGGAPIVIQRKRKRSQGGSSMYSEEELQRKRDKEAERREKLNGAYRSLMEVVYELDTTLKSGRESTAIHRQLNQSNNVMNKTDLVTRAVNVIRNLWGENSKLKSKVEELSTDKSSTNGETETTNNTTTRITHVRSTSALKPAETEEIPTTANDSAAGTLLSSSAPTAAAASAAAASQRRQNHTAAAIDGLTPITSTPTSAGAYSNILPTASLLGANHQALANLIRQNAHPANASAAATLAAAGLHPTPSLVQHANLLQVEALNSLFSASLNQQAAVAQTLFAPNRGADANCGSIGLPFSTSAGIDILVSPLPRKVGLNCT
mmetsp:Transcript_1283/g.1730  ORF Transcript_1283/g.1730 Transcript_1283/m.1730 type:complete len:395 (+) Transcript_1283:59-1243(+)